MEHLRNRTLPLEEDLRHEEHEWRASRLLFASLLTIMLLTVLGLFGGGPLSSGHVVAQGLRVEYPRFARFGASARVVIHAPAGADGSMRIALGRSLLDAFRISQVTPNPLESRIVPEGIEYRFRADPGGTPAVVVELQPAQRWLLESEIRSPDATVRFWQFIYP